ncbi:MAG TPA: acetyl-CoA carboxylase, biotin carboxyl carrier protein [Elusimicrobia bacterium]|nr:acetyl-CoA carboxylase, biotin carboxyl carrier protein [Elusimicrobiota bacterium]HBT60920.1 acetyl-CoA carboxylase, biotin carboxyl carrier protein [Elusimicrobiota bacterium]
MPQKEPAKPKRPGPDDGVPPRLKEVYGFMTENNLDTVEIDEPGFKLRLVRRKAPAHIAVPVAVAAGAVAAAQTAAIQPAAQPEPGMPAGAVAVKSSMMGIFYRASSPSSPPFAKEGDIVKPGQVLCIIEAMKVFNELKAECAGTVLKVLAENGKPVKAGQDIFWIQRA